MIVGLKKATKLQGKLGTFAGVFTPSILTILGIILFLRLGFVVGNTGLHTALLVVLAANAISILTSFSVAALATNLKIKGGGDYYIISRTLGVGFGSAIGLVLFFAQSISVGFYAIGFGEAIAALIGGDGSAAPFVAAAAVLGLFALAWLGADWASRFQYVVMALIFAALVSFALGAANMFDRETLAENWASPLGALPFWAAFAIFFPAVTGFTQGISMSGDLADSGRSIPRGTLLAVALSLIIYIAVAVLMAGSASLGSLSADNAAMNRIAAFAPLIDAGVIAATLSSALASFLGAPRILQALAADDVFPPIRAFAKGAGASNNPRRGVLLSGAIALGVVALGNLNLIAAVVSMFFLLSYGLLNYATYYEAKANSPSFRPSFRFYDRRLSLLGGLGCLGAMIAIDLVTSLVAATVVFAVYRYFSHHAPRASWSDSRRSHHLRNAREHLLAAAREPAHPRDWRPQILLFSADSKRRGRLLAFTGWVAGQSGLATVVQIIEGSGANILEQKEEKLQALRNELKEAASEAFPLVVSAPDLDIAVTSLVQSVGIGPMKVNTVLANWVEGRPAVFGQAAVGHYGQNMRTAFRLGCNLLVLDADSQEWAKLSQVDSQGRRIDVWWQENKTGELMLLLAYLMTRHEDWAQTNIRIMVPSQEGQAADAQLEAVTAFLEEVRIDAEALIVEDATLDAMVELSKETPVVFMPFAIHAGQFYHLFGGDVMEVLPKLQIVAMALAAQDVDLGADADKIDEAEVAAVGQASETDEAPTRNPG